MHATNTFPVDRHPQYRHYPTTICSIASGIIIEVKKKPHHESPPPRMDKGKFVMEGEVRINP
jgi:hypothetical protein